MVYYYAAYINQFKIRLRFQKSPQHFLFEEVVPGGTTVVTGPQSRLEDFDPATGEGHPGMKVRRNRGNATEQTRNPTTGGKQRENEKYHIYSGHIEKPDCVR